MRDAVFWLGRHRDRHQAHPPYLVALSMLAILGGCGSGGTESGTGGSPGSGGATGTAGATGSAGPPGQAVLLAAAGPPGPPVAPAVAGRWGRAAAPAGAGPSGRAVATGGGGASGDCPVRATFSYSEHTILNVSWPAGLATMGGTGVVHTWSKTTFTANGNTLSATAKACGRTSSGDADRSCGRGKHPGRHPECVVGRAHDAEIHVSGHAIGLERGEYDQLHHQCVIGFTTDPGPTWPTANTGIMGTVDADGDGTPGLTAAPRTGGGFVAPPTSILQTSRVDKVYLATRNSTSVMLTRTACDEFSGTVTFTHFDNHVMGCHVMGGQECTAAEATFVDNNRTIFQVSSATNQIKTVPDNATCADVRAALPM